MSDRIRVTAPEGGRVLVKRSMGDDTDINRIVNRWRQTGIMPSSGKQPLYGDFSDGQSFHSALNAVRDAEASFMQLPSKIRSYCGNDPGEYLDLCLNPERRKECEELGIKDAQLPEKAVLVRMEEAEKADSEKSP